MPKLMTETETAAMIGMSVHWLRKKRWEGGGIPFVKMTRHGAVRYTEEAVRQYLDGHYRTGTRQGDGRSIPDENGCNRPKS